MTRNEPMSAATRRLLQRKFAQRLSGLIAARFPDGPGRPGYGRIARDIREATGGSISGTYLWELATGRKRNVTLEQLDVLAEYFKVPPEYFLNEEVSGRLGGELELAAALDDERVRTLAVQAQGLSDATLDALLGMVREMRKLSGGDDARGLSCPHVPKGGAGAHSTGPEGL
ncbi:hypothetical protein [Streptomyces sp. MST-110588]|uniref:hypothetical protein n=1 Tax=Streptomyces sp. MST-110588 TaxID=2833628 RepID=UPI001F5DADEE|nr:hypothetical protein [Streptomyces sp. MST-110588]UNO39350.1 hypothetical protein KGS77_06635 [Streptomyces sp. MST-110588]